MSNDAPSKRILTINCGSSSFKFALFQVGQSEAPLLTGRVDRIGLPGGAFHVRRADGTILLQQTLEFPDHDRAFGTLFAWLQNKKPEYAFDAVGHRVVHGGTRYVQPAWISAEVLAALRELVPLAPNHLPHELRAIELVERACPNIPQIACFDTAFHRSMPPRAQTYALPKELRDEGLMRYGFHGLSYQYIVAELGKIAPTMADGRLVIAHLGNGASMAAVQRGASVDTTMGFTPAGGLVMSTRSGDLDPGVILYLLDKNGMNSASINRLVNQQAGLLGLSGLSPDMKDLLDQEKNDPRAADAIELFCYQAKKHLAALTAALGGLDTLIFTGGIGERAASIRARICNDLAFMGIHVDSERNQVDAAVISPDECPVTVRVMKTNEELMIARFAHQVLQDRQDRSPLEA